jgi:hypothetical protein
MDVKVKPRRDEMVSMSYIGMPSDGGLSRTMRQNSFVGRQLSRGTSALGQSNLTTSRYTPLREQPSQYN